METKDAVPEGCVSEGDGDSVDVVSGRFILVTIAGEETMEVTDDKGNDDDEIGSG